MTTKLTFLLLLFPFFSAFSQRLAWQKVDDISTKPLAIAGDSAQLWAAVHNGIYTSRDTGLTWILSKEFTKKDVFTRVVAAYGIHNILLVGLTHYTTNHTGCFDYAELKKFDRGQEIANIAGAALCSTSSTSGNYCPSSTYGDGPDFIDATHIKFINNYRRIEGIYCESKETTKILSEPNKSIFNIDNRYSRYTSNNNSSFSRDSGAIVAISDKKWLVSVRNYSKIMHFKFDTISNLTYKFDKANELPIGSNNIKRYFHKNNRLYLFYGENKVYFTDNFGDNWQEDSLQLNAEIRDIQVWDSTFIVLTNKGLSKSEDLIHFSPIYQNRVTLPDSVSSFPYRVGSFLFLNTHLYGLLRSLNNGLTWEHIEPKGLGYPSVLKAFWRGGDTITVKANDLFFTKTSPDAPFKPDLSYAVVDNFSSQLTLNNYAFRTIIIYGNDGAKGIVLRSNNTRSWDTILVVIDSLSNFYNGAKIKKDKQRLFFYGRELYMSEDFGATWQKLFNKPVSYVFIDKDSLLIMADLIYRSVDLGRNWTHPNGSYYLSGLTEQWANKQILTPIIPNSTYTNLNFSLNFGQTWLNRPPPPQCFNINTSLSSPNFREYKTYNFAYPYFSDSRYLYAFSNIGGLWRTNTEGVCSEPINIVLNDSICQGAEYRLNGNNYTQSGSYGSQKVSDFTNTCDTAFTLNLKVKNLIYQGQLNDTICVGSSYTFYGQTYYYANEGSVYRSYKSINCDSLIHLFLVVVNTPVCLSKTNESLIIKDLNISPNPNFGLFSINFDLKESQELTIELKDVAGKQVKTLLPKTLLTASKHRYSWPINDLPNGIYFLQMQSEKGILVRKIIKIE